MTVIIYTVRLRNGTDHVSSCIGAVAKAQLNKVLKIKVFVTHLVTKRVA